MTVGERIKAVREGLGMSQVDFADKINVSKQTLYKYENNIITNIPSDKIEAAANIGNVTPAYLMGWETQRKTIKNYDVQCTSEDETHLILDYRSLSKYNKIKASKYVHTLAEANRLETELLAAHERTDIKFTEQDQEHDLNIMFDDNEWE